MGNISSPSNGTEERRGFSLALILTPRSHFYRQRERLSIRGYQIIIVYFVRHDNSVVIL